MPTYSYQCRTCGEDIEVERLLVEDARHMVPTAYKGVSRVCGTLRRVWSANFNKVPGGGRD